MGSHPWQECGVGAWFLGGSLTRCGLLCTGEEAPEEEARRLAGAGSTAALRPLSHCGASVGGELIRRERAESREPSHLIALRIGEVVAVVAKLRGLELEVEVCLPGSSRGGSESHPHKPEIRKPKAASEPQAALPKPALSRRPRPGAKLLLEHRRVLAMQVPDVPARPRAPKPQRPNLKPHTPKPNP